MVLEVLERILEELARFYLNGHCAWVIARRANGYFGDAGVEIMVAQFTIARASSE